DGALWNPWSPASDCLALIKQDTQDMALIPTIEWLKTWEQAREFIALPAGGTLFRSELYLLDLYSRRPRNVDLGDMAAHFLRVLAWLPDGSELLVARYDRLFSRVEVLAVNALTCAVRVVLEEE